MAMISTIWSSAALEDPTVLWSEKPNLYGYAVPVPMRLHSNFDAARIIGRKELLLRKAIFTAYTAEYILPTEYKQWRPLSLPILQAMNIFHTGVPILPDHFGVITECSCQISESPAEPPLIAPELSDLRFPSPYVWEDINVRTQSLQEFGVTAQAVIKTPSIEVYFPVVCQLEFEVLT